jgi:outer membrane receptor for ferrienterochelin and colicins
MMIKNIHISILVINIFLLYSTNALSQEKTDAMLFGDVKSGSTGEHISFATIVVKGTRIGTTADATGHYKLTNLPVGENTIIASAVGYKTQEKEVVMERGKATNLFFELEEDILELEQVVITGTRTKHYIKDVPVRTEVITAKKIESKNARDLYEVLEGTPGIRVEQQCQFCNFTMIRMQGLGAEHTQVLINGQPVYSGLASIYGLQQIGTVNIDRIEVVKGAGSALYGSSAVAGAINIITKEPELSPSTTVDLQFGKYHTNKYDISSSIRNEKGNLGLNIFAQKLTGDAIDETSEGMTRDQVKQKDGISDRVATNLNNAGFGLYMNDIFSQHDKIILRGRYINEKREGGIMGDDYYKNPLTDGTESITTNRYESELSYHTAFKDHSELDISLAYVNHNRDATNDSYLCDYMETHHDSVPDLRNMRPYLAKEHSFTSTLTYGRKIANHQLLIGTQAYNNKLEESGMYVVIDPESDYFSESYKSVSHKSATEFGFFLQDEWSFNNKFIIVPGIRLDKHDSEEKYQASKQVSETNIFPVTRFEETSVNPRIALKYDLSKRVTLRANTGTGFRAPFGFSEDLHLCSGSPRIWKSSNLKPERSVSYNFSADYYGSQFRTSINIFRTDLKDKIGFTNASADVSSLGYDYQWENIDNAFVQGIEASAIIHLLNKLEFDIDFTYNQGEYGHIREDWEATPYAEMSKYISRFPKTTGNITIEYNLKKWNFSVSGNYQGTMYIDYFNEDIDPVAGDQSRIKKTSPFMLFNTRVSGTLNVFRLYAGINNIFDYIQDEKHIDDAAFMYAPTYGTMFYGGISIEIKH